MKRVIALFFLLFFCIIAQAADKVPMTTRQHIKQKIRPVAPEDIKILSHMIARGESQENMLRKWKAMLIGTNDQNLNVNPLVQSVMRASKQQQENELNKLKDKVQYNIDMKKKIQNEQDKVRKAIITTGSAPIMKINITKGKENQTIISSQNAGIVKTEQERQDYLRYLQSKLNAVGHDAEISNMDLQNGLQKTQQLLQMQSKISKLLSDTAMDTLKKMRD